MALGVSSGCIDPRADYDAFVARAIVADAQPPSSGDAEPTEPCPQVLSGQATGVFYGACLTTAASGDLRQATYVKLDSMLTANADHTAGTLTVQLTSLRFGATNVSDTVGATQSPPPAPISPQCTYVIEAGTTTIPAQADYATTELVLTNTRYRGKLVSEDESCAALDATVTTPVTVDLTMGGNYCVFRRAPADGAVTPFALSDFQCPGAPPRM
ncbi:MAG: hypothetical protein ACRENE_19695 [Polyangiaceae bacterium]